jgi:hypothetical protein
MPLTCPHCGGALIASVRPASRRDNIRAQLRRFESAAWVRNDETGRFESQDDNANSFPVPAAPGTYREIDERTPIHAPSLSSQWAPALAKSLTVWAGTSTLSFAIMAGYVNMPRPGLAAFIMGGIPGAYQWMRDQEYFKQALYQIKNFTEEVLQKDIDGDGAVGKPPEPGTIIITGRNSKPESESSKKRRAMIAFVELVYRRQHASPPLNTGIKALYGTDLPAGYKVNENFHKEIGALLVDSGYARTKPAGANTTWELLPDVTLDELNAAVSAWDD